VKTSQSTHLPDHEFNQAMQMIEKENISAEEKVEMLMQIGMGIQQKPKSPQQLLNAIKLYDSALKLCPENERLITARLEARKGTAYQAIPDSGADYLLKAQAQYEVALPVLNESGLAEEVAEVEMNLGLVLQTLVSFHKAQVTECIAAYQRSLKVFDRQKYPTEYAILHNNLATAFLSIPMNDERGKMREALAVQSFETALEVVNLIDHPSEYAMLQNNLGNALQYVSSSHPVENNLRALDAYTEALKVRNANDTPLEYANTISNKANCLRNLPDDLENPKEGNPEHLMEARALYREAQQIFTQYGDAGKVDALKEVLAEVEQDLGTSRAGSRNGKGFGEARI
jgi:tetratricopeptide (TPR) repeat protein